MAAGAWWVHGMPGRQIMEPQAPRRSCPDKPTQAMQDCTHAVLPLGGVFRHEGHVGSHQGPRVVADITGKALTLHAISLASSKHKGLIPSRRAPCVYLLS